MSLSTPLISFGSACRYDQELNETLSKAAKALTIDEAKDMTGDVNILYKSQEHYETLTERLGILREWKVSLCKAKPFFQTLSQQ